MPLLFALFARWGFGERVSRMLGYATALIGAAALLGLAWAIWLHRHDRSVLDRHEAAIAGQVTAATQAANDTANANDARRQVEDARAAVLTEEAIRHAQEDHPAEATAAAGPVSRAAVEQLRRRAAAARSPSR